MSINMFHMYVQEFMWRTAFQRENRFLNFFDPYFTHIHFKLILLNITFLVFVNILFVNHCLLAWAEVMSESGVAILFIMVTNHNQTDVNLHPLDVHFTWWEKSSFHIF